MSAQSVSKKALKIWDEQYGSAEKANAACGCVIARSAFHNENSKFAWDLDHIWPKSLNGSGAYDNLQILCIGHNRGKGDNVGVITFNDGLEVCVWSRSQTDNGKEIGVMDVLRWPK